MIKFKIISDNKTSEISACKGSAISDILKEQRLNLCMPCNGKGNCGKCKVRIIEGDLKISEFDKRLLSESELNKGYRLACKYILESDTSISIEFNKKFQILNEYAYIEDISSYNAEIGFAIAIDIGTTTVAFNLINLETSKRVGSFSLLNSQCIFGSDVISRIEVSNSGRLSKMQELIKTDLLLGIKKLIEALDLSLLKRISICANTTMVYLLLGKNCEKLGIYPFETDFYKTLTLPFNDIFMTEKNNFSHCDVFILPCISAFVGGDIVSGAIFCSIDQKPKTLLIDIGTNGELLLNDGENLISTSAAAGPAFEGGNISCGTGSISGAVSSTSFENDEFIINTINNEAPVGVCGCGLIDIAAILLENKFMDESGLLTDGYFEDGVEIAPSIIVTQHDIRQLQMAKGAIRAAIECLFRFSSIKLKEVENVLISGGFGFGLNLQNAFKIGLFPQEFKGKISIIGNSSLGGASKFVLLKNTEKADFYASSVQNIELSRQDEFNELFIKFMNF